MSAIPVHTMSMVASLWGFATVCCTLCWSISQRHDILDFDWEAWGLWAFAGALGSACAAFLFVLYTVPVH